MEHQRQSLSKENTIEHKYKSARFSSFSLPNPWLAQPVISSVVKGINGRVIRRARRGYIDENC